MSSDLQCARCGAPLELPSDFGIWVTPFGEDITPLPAPATNLEIGYCAAVAGPHIVELSPAMDGPFSIAIAFCTRNALPKVLPRTSK